MERLIVVLMLIGSFVFANWKPLKLIDSYGKGSFNLKKGVEYIEINYHGIFRVYSYQNRKNYLDFCFYKIGKKPLESLGQSALRTFKKYRKVGNRAKALVEYDSSTSKEYNLVFYNAYMIDSNNKFWLLENKQDLIDSIRPIDTQSEVALIIWLNGHEIIENDKRIEYYKVEYKRLKSGYKVKERYIKMDKNYKGCTKFKYIYNISKSGKLSKKLLSKIVKEDCRL